METRAEMTDAELLARYTATASQEVFGELVRRHAGTVYGVCLRVLGDRHAAEDAMQATFMVLLKKAGGLSRRSPLKAWLFGVARNCAMNVRRAGARRARREREVGMQFKPTGEDSVGSLWAGVQTHLDAAIDSLPRREKDAIVLHYLSGMPQSEVATELGVSQPAISRCLDRALDKLRGKLSRAGVSLSGGAALGALLAGNACASAPASAIESTIAVCSGQTAATTGAAAAAKGVGQAMMWAKVKIATMVLGITTLVGGGAILAGGNMLAAPKAIAAPVPEGARDILNTGSYWRWHVTSAKPTYMKDGKEQLLPRHKRMRAFDPCIPTAPPPAGWQGTDFNDVDWPRSRPGWFNFFAFRLATTQVSLRNRFEITDPAKADLYFSAQYIGGIVVYLNGKEVGRADLPAGKLAPDSWAKSYEDKYYVGADGKCIKMHGAAPKPHNRRMHAGAYYTTVRSRKCSFKLPREALRKGSNVLAIELRRSSYSLLAAKWARFSSYSPQWAHAFLLSARLACVGDGATANVARPEGVQVWNQDMNDRVTARGYGNPSEKLRPVRIVAARNGSFTGQVVVSSGKPFDIKVTAGDLSGVKNGAKISAKNIDVLYGKMDWYTAKYGLWCMALAEKPVANVAVAPETRARWTNKGRGAVQPLVFRVNVAADAKPGKYEGEVAITAGGKNFVVPLLLEVADWKVPDPNRFRTFVGVYQSPTSVAMQYKVKPWSDEHWKLLEKSIAMLGRAGNKALHIPVVEQTQFGNDQGFVTWIRKADPSTGSGQVAYDYDISVLERHVKLALKHWKSLDYVSLQIWHAAGGGGKGGWDTRPADTKCTVTVRDEKSGKIESVQVPVFGTPESKKFWRPVLAKIQASLKKLGAEKGMCVGILSDSTAPNAVFEMFNDVFPGGKGAFWNRGCHGTSRAKEPYQVKGKPKSNKVILHEHCYGMHMVPYDIAQLPPVHTFRGRPPTAYFRHSNFENAVTLVSYRSMASRALFTLKQGLGRICLDYWNLQKDKRGRSSDLFNRWPHSTCAQRKPSLMKMSWPGPTGAETTTRYEQFIEGIQHAEAVIILSEGAGNEAKVGKELAARCRKLLRENLKFCYLQGRSSERVTSVQVNHHGWKDLLKRTYELAGEVSRKL
jgi:RNA polymerase sigma factor (sigma-70 family)